MLFLSPFPHVTLCLFFSRTPIPSVNNSKVTNYGMKQNKFLYIWLLKHITFTASKIVRIRSYSGPHFPVFGLNTERYSVSFRIQSKCGKMPTRVTPNTDTFYALIISKNVRSKVTVLTYADTHFYTQTHMYEYTNTYM